MNGIVDVFELLTASSVIVSKNKVSPLECIKLNSIALFKLNIISTIYVTYIFGSP